MIRDVFYYGIKPHVHPREKFANNLQHAREQATTEHFWIINEFCDYKNFDWEFDFEFLPDEDVWAKDHNNVWPSQHQKDSGTWLCSKYQSEIIIYRADVDPVKRKSIVTDNWKILESIDESKWDFSWHPDPTDPAYIYKWPCKFYPAEISSCIEYHVPNAIGVKFMEKVVELKPNFECIVEYDKVDKLKFDISWRPDPREPAFIYTWGNKYVPAEIKPTFEYKVPGATQRKYMGNIDVLPNTDCWKINHPIDNNSIDFNWRPDPREPDYIYVWGNQYLTSEQMPTVEYHVPGASQYKYLPESVKLSNNENYWVVNDFIDKKSFDFSWAPHPYDPPYIYVWGNQFLPAEQTHTIEYRVPGATQYKYMSNTAKVVGNPEFWNINVDIDINSFDFSWVPEPYEPPFIYVWGNQFLSAEQMPTVEYRVPGATQYKYMHDRSAKIVGNKNYFTQILEIDESKFDFSWSPHPYDPPYIYVFGNQWNDPVKEPTLLYTVPGATEKKYVTDIIAKVKQNKNNFTELIPVKSFDYSWRPDPNDPPYIYVFGNQWNDAVKEPTILYEVSGATDKKYITDIIAKVKPNKDKFVELIPIEDFDYSWRPDPNDPPYVYVWGNQWNDAVTEPTLLYKVENATDKKYITETLVKVKPNKDKFVELIPIEDFDYSWRPDPNDPPYIYVFGNQWNDAVKEPTLQYIVPNAIDKKYITDITAKVKPNKDKFVALLPIESFDYSWRPDPNDPPYIYVFGNQWNDAVTEPTLLYKVENATDKKYITEIVAKVKPSKDNFVALLPIEDFDYSWRPDPNDPPYIYVFGNQWNDAPTEPSLEFVVKNATDKKYVNYPVAKLKSNKKNWIIPHNFDVETFDFSWRPNPYSPPQIYQWENNGPRYIVENATEVVLVKNDTASKKPLGKYKIKTTLEDLINEYPDEVFWALNPNLNYDDFDFSWRPNEENFRHVNVFGNEYSQNTQTYFINAPLYLLGYKELNYINSEALVVDSNLSMFFIDKGNIESKTRFEELKNRYPQLQKTRFLNNWVDTINRCIIKSDTKLFWVVSSELDYSEFKFDFYPSPWQENMVHVFGTQWSHWGNTYLINKEKFSDDTKYVKIIEHLNVLNFVKTKRAKATSVLYDIVYIDHGNEYAYPDNVNIFKFNNSYFETFKNIVDELPLKKEHYIWVCSSVCDYTDFDFSYITDPFARDQLHVFPSNKQKFGDTFFFDVNKLRLLLNDLKSLEDFGKLNFNQNVKAKRLTAPTIINENDTHTYGLNNEFNFPYINLVTVDNKDLVNQEVEPMNLWDSSAKQIVMHSTGGTYISVPKEAINVIKKELYDYPYIITSKNQCKSKPLDIVFLSNNEVNADTNYEHLLKVTKNLPNRVVRVDGIDGRVKAYHSVAEASETPWVFTVFAKLKINPNFDFSWQPDRLQIPKHYIFKAENPVNGLIYGHQAMIAYNKKLTLNNTGQGLDFTLDDQHEVVNLLSGVANFNTDPWSTWRTAFREVIKLQCNSDIDSMERLDTWLSVGDGPYTRYCLEGAKHAVQYFKEVEGNIEKLKLTYEWKWLNEYFTNKYKL